MSRCNDTAVANRPHWGFALALIALAGVLGYLAGSDRRPPEPPGWEADVQVEDGRPKKIRFRPAKD